MDSQDFSDRNLYIKFLALVSCKALITGYAQFTGAIPDTHVKPVTMQPSRLLEANLITNTILGDSARTATGNRLVNETQLGAWEPDP
jgi:hypothetical protein